MTVPAATTSTDGTTRRSTEWTSAAADLTTAAETYASQYFGRVLSREGVMSGLEEISVIQDAANRLHTVWRERLASLPSRGQIDSVADSILHPGAQGTLARILHAFHSGNDRTDSVKVMRDFERVSNDGYEILGLISPTLPYAIHLEGEASRAIDRDDETDSLRAAATNARQTIEVTAGNIDRDIDSQRSQVQLLTSYTQTSMTEEVRGLTRALTLLTMVVVLLTVGALIISALSAH
jgi:hypothetical protein